jgi:hypothetical protein
MIYTALEIVKLTGVATPEQRFGKERIKIDGIAAREANKLINTQDATKVHVQVGAETFDVDLPKQDAPSEAVAKAREAKGAEATKAFEASQVAKGRIKPKKDTLEKE